MLPKILIVDDEEMIRINLVAFLEDEGYPVVVADSAEKGLELLDTELPVAAIVDMRLPKMDGNEFITLASKKLPRLKFIIHTGSSDYIVPQQLRVLGITDEQVLMKPVVDMYQFISLLTKLMAN